MNTWIAVILAIVAIALATYAIYKLFGQFTISQVEGLEDIKASALAAEVQSSVNKGNINLINAQLGKVQVATTGFTSTAVAVVTPAFPIVLV